MNHNLRRAIDYVKNNPMLGFNHVVQKFHIDPFYLQSKWSEGKTQKKVKFKA